LAFAVDDGKKSTIVVGKYESHLSMAKPTADGGVGGRWDDLRKLLRNGGGKWRHGAFYNMVTVAYKEYNAAIMNTAKFEEICIKWDFELPSID